MIVGFALGIFRMLVDTPVTLGLSGFAKRLCAGFVSLDHQQYLFPVFQRADHDCLGHRDGGGEPRNRRAG